MICKDNKYEYIIISPAKDEGQYIKFTVESVLNQTVKPKHWIIVNDGSKDGTKEIVEEYCKRHNWIKLITIERGSKRQPGAAVIHAFNAGYDVIRDMQYEFVVKLDCDVRFESNYFEDLLAKFKKNEKLGIASGIYLEQKAGDWIPINMPEYHAAGACKVIKKKCFEEIGGFVPKKGWDTIDEIRAQVKGWSTCHDKDIIFYHLKNEGTGIGHINTNMMHGEIHYVIGGSLLFFLMKTIHRMIFGYPQVVGGLMMFIGYMRSLMRNQELLASKEEVKFYNKLLRRRMTNKIREMIK